MPTDTAKDIAKQIVRQEMIARGLRVQDLARLVGRDPEHVTNVICGSSQSRPARAAIEQTLGVKIWSAPQTIHPTQ